VIGVLSERGRSRRLGSIKKKKQSNITTLLFSFPHFNSMSLVYSTDTDNSISAPLPTHFSPSLHYQHKKHSTLSLQQPQSELVGFTVPDNFQLLEKKESAPKSNSWFNTTAFRPSSQNKSIRRVASAPNTNNPAIIPRIPEKQYQFDRIKLCRRTYSSSSIKVKHVEVGPSSFTKLRMLGKGDVGKVYMVRQKGTDKLFAMKGNTYKSSSKTKKG
jgi:hypothetical protein